MADIVYTSVDGVSPSGSEVLATLESSTAETLGLDSTTEQYSESMAVDNTGSWTGFADSFIFVTDHYNIQRVSSDARQVQAHGITTGTGQVYLISVDVKSNSGTPNILLGVTTSGYSQTYLGIQAITTSWATYTRKVTFPSGYTHAVLWVTAANSDVDFKNYSIKLENDLVSGGSMGNASYWTLGDGWSVASRIASCDGTQVSNSNFTQTVTPENNTQYVVKFTLSNYSAGAVTPFLGSTEGTARSANGTYTETITTAAGVFFILQANSTFVGDIDDVTAYPAITDSTANDDGLEIHGELIKSVVNTNSGLVGYSGFDENNFIEQPYSSNLDFGTGGLCFIFWIKESANTVAEKVFSRSNGTPDQRIYAQIGTTGFVSLVVDDNTTLQTAVTSTTVIDDGLWHHVCLQYEGSTGSGYVYIDGVLNNSLTSTVLLTLNSSDAVLKIGVGFNNGSPLTNGSLSLFKALGALLTQTQITTMYNNEKGLFLQGRPFREVGVSYTLDVPLLNSSSAQEEDRTQIQDTLSLKRATLFHASKRVWSAQSALVALHHATLLDYYDLQHFINSTKRGATFTFDERGNEVVSVILLSNNHGYQREGNAVDDYHLNFSVREA